MSIADIRKFIDEYISRSTDQRKVTVFPLQCGLGKSSYIRYAIQKALLENKGLIVITDKIDGLKSLINAAKPEDRETISYIQANINRIAVLTSDSIKAELPNLYGKNAKPVILMTTQRYFNLQRDEILKLTGGSVKRETILFDEKPFFISQIEISEKELNAVDTALRQAIDDTALPDNKYFLLEQWQIVMSDIRRIFAEYETKNDRPQRSYWHDPSDHMTEDDERFLKLINSSYRDNLDRYSINIRRYIRAVVEMYTEGATFCSKKRLRHKAKDREYHNSFIVLIDNSDLLLNVGARVIIFDGSADIHPEYDLDYVDMVDCSEHKRRLHNLTINIIDVPTAKHRLVGKQNENYVNAIVNDVHIRCGDAVIFSHKELKTRLNKDFSRVDYFGNIKGKNDYRNATETVQIGCFRFPDTVYELETFFTKLFTSEKAPKKCFKIIGYSAVDDVKNRMILADVEQNLFRSKIRDADNWHPVTYTIYMSAYMTDKTTGKRTYNDLVNMIFDRYKPLGATINIINTPTEFQLLKTKSRNTDNPTHAQMILNWLAIHQNQTFKLNDMLSELGISNKRFDKIKSLNLGIAEIFQNMSKADNRKGYYKA